MQHQATSTARQHAKTLRAGMTDAERRLWQRLRLGQLGVKFRRQHPLGPYVLDFACLEPKLAIEVDGSQHLEQVAYDARRSAWLGEQGYAVQRFDANAVLAHTDAVVQAVINRVNELRGAPRQGNGPHPGPPPAGEGDIASSTESTNCGGRLDRASAPTPALPQRGRVTLINEERA